ncbi:MAG: hypothetical protein K0S68_109 [Candidatus Saccharibacteria bacterium]|jgi:uncharacterized Zn finger protein|nr:hypothetical protein [Candidatus Saccharibacteria bacterium]
MPTIFELVSPPALESLSTPSEYKLGREIVRNEGVELEEFGPQRVVAHATGGQRRLVELRAAPEGLDYTCTCSSKLTQPCKHVVAVGLVAWDKQPK